MPDLLKPHLDRDVEEVVGDHLSGLGRPPALPTPTLLRVHPDLGGLGADVGINQLQVVQPGQEVEQQTLDHRRPRGLEPVTNFCRKNNKSFG